ncbi:TPA: hypothetical protein UMU67_000056 [Stenotrophomonas maltophilia]|nr:hypothetical protein [Stenotrophomonas maltophilia]
MRSIDLLLDKAREKCERPSDRALAEKMRVTASAVSKWRKGGVITETHASALAAIAGMDGEIVVRVMEEQAETPAQRRVWRSVLDRLSAAAAVLVLVVVAAPGVARAKAFEIKNMDAGSAAVCILCSTHPGPAATWPWRPLVGQLGSPDAGASQGPCVVRMSCLAAPGVPPSLAARYQHRFTSDSRQI